MRINKLEGIDMTLKIRAFYVAEFAVPVSAILNNLGEQVPKDIEINGISDVEWPDGTVGAGVKIPASVYYIENDQHKILVDTGVGDLELIRDTRLNRGDKFYLYSKPEWDLVHQLKEIGVSPEEIDIVINTHLHWDHIGGNLRFKNAKFLIQKDELPYALVTPEYAPFYFKAMRKNVTGIADQIVLLDGDAKVSEGVYVWKMGGHSPGIQVVAIETNKGLIVLASDVINRYENLNYSWPGMAGNIWNLSEIIQAYQRIKKEGDIIIPGHDWKVWDIYKDGIII